MNFSSSSHEKTNMTVQNYQVGHNVFKNKRKKKRNYYIMLATQT